MLIYMANHPPSANNYSKFEPQINCATSTK